MQTRKGSQYLQEYQVEYIKENYRTLTTAQMAKAIGCSQSTVFTWCKKLYLKPTKSYFQFNAPDIPVCEKY